MATTSATLGLDLGNTSCTMAVMRQGALQVIANEQGNRSTPSCIAFVEGETLTGEAGLGQMARNARHTVVDLLVMLGRTWEDPAVQAAAARWRFAHCAAEKDGTVAVEVAAGKRVGAVRLLALLVAELKAAADAYADAPVKEVVLAVPPHFSAGRTEALVEAARSGGMRVKCALPAPLAVALLFLSESDQPSGFGPATARRVLVVDVGGSSSWASVVDCDGEGDVFGADGHNTGKQRHTPASPGKRNQTSKACSLSRAGRTQHRKAETNTARPAKCNQPSKACSFSRVAHGQGERNQTSSMCRATGIEFKISRVPIGLEP